MATVSMKCPNCGGELIFDPKSQKYKCEYCGSDFALDEISTEEAATQAVSDVVQEREDTSDNHTQQRTAGAEDAAVLYTCPSCGAQIVTDQTTAATFCYYCHNPVLLSEQLSGAFHPDQIIPFEIDRKQAEEHFLDFVQKKKFVPNAFFQKNQIEKLTGIYFPYWVCDAEVEGSLTAEGNKVRVWVSGDEEFTETRIYRMEREGHVSLREITKHALKKPIIYWRKVYFLMIFPKQQNSGWDICPVSMRKNVILNGKNWRRKYIAKWKIAPEICWKIRFTDITAYIYFQIISDRSGNSGSTRCFRCGL